MPSLQTEWPRRLRTYSRQTGVRRLVSWDVTPCWYTLMTTAAYFSETSVYIYTSQHATAFESWYEWSKFSDSPLLLHLQQPADTPAGRNKINDMVPDPIFSSKSVSTLFETEFSEGQARKSAHANIPDYAASHAPRLYSALSPPREHQMSRGVVQLQGCGVGVGRNFRCSRSR
jgi:hypothetical protein